MMKQAISWLRMFTFTDTPHSEAAYTAHLGSTDIAVPTNGGILQSDGTWLQQGWRINGKWPQSLPGIARNARQLYIPSANSEAGGESVLPVLDSEALQQAAAAELVGLALTDRFDSPWDGALIDLEGIPSSYRDKLSSFLLLLSYELRVVGLRVGISVRGIASDPGPDYDGAYSHDFAVLAQAADFVDLRCYGYWKPLPRSIAPYWWIRDCIRYALSQGIPAQRIFLGLGSFSRYQPVVGGATERNVTHTQALKLICDNNSFVQWIESNNNGLVREKYADIGDGYIWLHDGDTMRHGLDLIDEYGLRGLSHFLPGMGAESTWQVIADWKHEPAAPVKLETNEFYCSTDWSA